MAATIEPNRTATELLAWTDLSDTGNVPYLKTSQLDICADVACLLNISMAQDNTVAIATSATWSAWGKSGSTEDDWNEFAQGSYGTVANGVSDFSTTGLDSGEITAKVSDTTHMENYGQKVFMKHSTLANSMANKIVDFSNDVMIELLKASTADFTDALQLFCPSAGDGVAQWPVRVPDEYWATMVSFQNPDNDAIYACRVQYNLITDYTSV